MDDLRLNLSIVVLNLCLKICVTLTTKITRKVLNSLYYRILRAIRRYGM
jgi:hypothetical protein